MKLDKLHSAHLGALGESARAQSPEVLAWAEARVDYFANRICETRRERVDANFDFRRFAR